MSFDSGLDHDEHEVHPVKQRFVSDNCFKDASHNGCAHNRDTSLHTMASCFTISFLIL